MASKSNLLAVFFLLLGGVFVAAAIYLLKFPGLFQEQAKKEATSNEPVQLTTTPNIPDQLKNQPQILEYDLAGKTYLRTQATITKIILPTSFNLHLDTNQEATVRVTSSTKLFRANYQVNSTTGEYAVIDLQTIAQADLKSLTAGKEVRVTLEKKLIGSKSPIIASEFVVLE